MSDMMNRSMSIGEVIDAIKTQVMYVSAGWDSASMDNDAKEDFDSLYIIAMGLDIIKEQLENKDASLERYKKRCLDLITEKNELKMKLEAIKKEVNK